MLAVSLGVVFVGYSLTYYGISQLQGGNWGLFDLTVPNSWTAAKAAIPKDKAISQ